VKTVAWVVAAISLVLLIVGLTVPSLGFLVGTVPVLLVVVVLLLLLLSWYKGRRIPR